MNSRALLLLAVLPVSCAHADRSGTIRLSKAEYRDRVEAAWLGQVVGMLVGFPFEHEAASVVRVEGITKRHEGTPVRWDAAPVDDDWYYEMVALNGFEKHGIGMTVEQLGEQWLENSAGTWGSSRGAREALLKGARGAEAGHPRHNAEWWTMGAQFSADLYGLLAPGRPNLAARLARTLGHINGYAEGTDGAVFVAGMVSLAFVDRDPRSIVRKAAGLVHPESPYRRCLDGILRRAEAGRPWREIAQAVEDEWRGVYPASNNAVANGGMLALGLWFGGGDLMETLNIISSAADYSDADCNAASGAAVLAAAFGPRAIPKALSAQFGDRMRGDKLGDILLTPPVDVRFSDLARRTAAIGERFLAVEGVRIDGDGFLLPDDPPRALPRERFELADLTKFWNPEWHLERAGFGPMRYFHRGTFLAGDALATWPANEARGVVLWREVGLGPKPRLSLKVGAHPGRSWMLEIYADHRRLVARKVSAPPRPGGWKREDVTWETVDVDLAAFAGRSVHLRLYQSLLMTDGVPGCAFWKDVRVE